MTRRTLARIVTISLLAATGCASYEGRFADDGTSPRTPEALATATGLGELAWQPIPLQERTGGQAIESLQVIGDTLYAIDASNTVHAISLAEGTHRWVLQLDRRPDRPIASGGGFVAFLSRNHLTVATRASGSVTLRSPLEFTPSSGAALALDSLYAGAWGDGYRLRSVALADAWNGWFVPAEQPITAAPLVVGSGPDQSIVYASQSGRVVSLPARPAGASAPPEPNWVYRALGAVAADLAADADTIYAASEDHGLYAIDRRSGILRWKWLGSRTALTEPPVPSGAVVYQSLPGAVAAIEKADGAERWRFPGATRFLTRIGAKDVLQLEGESLAVVDTNTGEELARIDTPLLALVAQAPESNTLVFSDGETIYAID